jgi:CRISPR/Cas system-associated exonuclease Cas4 (RecB family)
MTGMNGHGHLNGHAAGTAAISLPAPEAGERELAGVLSPSQVATYISCPAKYWFKYGLGIEQVQGSALSLGKALHVVVRKNNVQKIETKTDILLAHALELYEDAWCEEADRTEFQPDEDRDQLRLMGRACLTKYQQQIAPTIQPAQVELPVSGVIGGVHVRGFVDLLDIHGRIIDLKSAKSSPSKTIRPDYRFQISTYEAITPGANGQAQLDTIVKLKKEVKAVSQPFDVTDADRKHVQVMYPLVQEAARSGLYPPNRNNYLCSRRYCSYVDQCLAEYGGAVAGETA